MLQVHDVLGFVSQMRPPVFELRDAGLGIVGRNPILVRHLFVLACLVVAADLFVGWLVLFLDDAFLAHQPRYVLLPVLARVAANNALHGSIGFQCRAVDTYRLTVDQLAGGRYFQDELKHFVKDFQRQAFTTLVGSAFRAAKVSLMVVVAGCRVAAAFC